MGRTIAGWKIDDTERERLLSLFPPRYSRVLADHITLRFGTDARTPLPLETEARIIGEADDGVGVQALVVEIGGTAARGDGSHFHITWSLGAGRRAKESNDVIGASGWTARDPVPLHIEPKRWQS